MARNKKIDISKWELWKKGLTESHFFNSNNPKQYLIVKGKKTTLFKNFKEYQNR